MQDAELVHYIDRRVISMEVGTIYTIRVVGIVFFVRDLYTSSLGEINGFHLK